MASSFVYGYSELMGTLWVTPDELENPTSPDAFDVSEVTTRILWALSGRKYDGVKTVTESYSCQQPSIYNGHRYPLRHLHYHYHCSTHYDNRLRLRGKPIRSVSQLVVHYDTASRRVIDPREYEVIDRAYIRPTFGATWRPCSNVEVTYSFGASVPAMGRRAAVVMANELLRARSGQEDCRLPDRVTSVSRQGVSFTILDPQDFLKDGRTGIYEVDLFLKAVNPDGARKRAKVFSPDLPRAARVTAAVPGTHDVAVTPGLAFQKTFVWETDGFPTHITGNWLITAQVKNAAGTVVFDLEPYFTVEPSGHVGQMDLYIPANVTTTFNVTGTWSLVMTHVSDPGLVIRLLGGNVVTQPSV